MVDGGVVTDVARVVGMLLPPLPRGHAEKRYVQDIGFLRVDDGDLPDLQMIPIASVALDHFCGDRENELSPACLLNPSNSMGLKWQL